MARIPFPDPATMDADLLQSLGKLGSLNVTRMMAHQPGLMQAYAKMGVAILRHGALDPVLRELIILRVGQLCESEYEHHQHISVARMVGMSEETLAASEANDRSGFSDRERAALAVTDEIFRDRCASAEAIATAAAMFSPAELVEIVVVTGYYIMTAGYLRSLDIEIEDTPPLGDRMMKGEKSAISG